ncbi:ankyrin repeat domain-containing protein 49 [Maniola hyperantus]|uniref:ankyrin repeat domain-containing protein 49 n=1 Tax=Aphantopus hyperantus TaxID=2795564 RepID=UPI001569DC3F|nr:ankyrin repeat domain-containing protein 49 isoform X1 [Maniola hyperantus]XP_034836087.1 ankyrin repeat domain-containing protein 49 isoform X1 [Maniola hyperantus]XP_034836093.1 ankyrin repeat domain-containing protein 49 isoform X1 [Maniola hyperantus]XP_034836100.1 ankyrin repeat domain-containing protein 49 isoform X1 [Maniola hyperantus]XP_034836108.1 ankyrin repeat domain-containing protein 49 isoform X2 [Maniola hyperantus]
MSDSEEEEIKLKDFKEISDEIERCKKNPETSGMFVSGWDDADQDVDIVKNPKENPNDHVLWAAENGELETLKELITKQPGLVHARDTDGYTPLHRAAYSNHINIISYLLSVGANIGAKTELGWTPLHSACNWNNYASAARLLAAGADPTAFSDGEQTPMHLAAAMSHCKSTLLILLLREDLVETARRRNHSDETPEQLARGHGIYAPLFDMVLPAASHIRSLSFTCNPYIRAQND